MTLPPSWRRKAGAPGSGAPVSTSGLPIATGQRKRARGEAEIEAMQKRRLPRTRAQRAAAQAWNDFLKP